MDPLDNPRMVKRPTDDPAEPANETTIPEAQESGKQANDSDSPIDDVRLEKVESIKKALADGTYSVSAEEVARKLIEHMLEPKE